jgi:hypothetical protein
MNLAEKLLAQKLETGKKQLPAFHPIPLFLLYLPKREQRLEALKHKLSSYRELTPQASDTFHHAVLLACNADNIGRQKLEILRFS